MAFSFKISIYTLNYREQVDGYQRRGGWGMGGSRGWGLKSTSIMMKKKIKISTYNNYGSDKSGDYLVHSIICGSAF